MNQIIPSQSRQTASPKFWCRFSKTGALTVALASIVMPLAHADLVNVYGTLSIAPTGILDVKDNNVVVRTGSEATITNYIRTGLYNGAGGFWDGPGINSSVAALDPSQNTAVGILNNADAGYTMWPINGVTGLPTANAVALTGSEILFKHTYFGDSDLNGLADAGDALQLNAGFGAPGNWLNGDYDYDGNVGPSDVLLFNAAFGASSGNPALVSQGGIAAVPEPTGIALLSVGILGILSHRRRR